MTHLVSALPSEAFADEARQRLRSGLRNERRESDLSASRETRGHARSAGARHRTTRSHVESDRAPAGALGVGAALERRRRSHASRRRASQCAAGHGPEPPSGGDPSSTLAHRPRWARASAAIGTATRLGLCRTRTIRPSTRSSRADRALLRRRDWRIVVVLNAGGEVEEYERERLFPPRREIPVLATERERPRRARRPRWRETWRSVNTARPHFSSSGTVSGALNDRY